MNAKKVKDTTKGIEVSLFEDMKYTGLKIHKMKPGDQLEARVLSDRELCLVLVTGYGNLDINDETYTNIGNRDTVFVQSAPYAAYITAEDYYRFEALTECEVAMCYAPSHKKYPSRLIKPETMLVEHRGEGQLQRIAKNILPETEEADSLLVVEVITKGGNWSSFAHRHDEDDLPNQSYLEEIYYHKLDPEEGSFAVQRVFNDDKTIDDVFVIENRSAVLVKEGYHPVSVPPGNDLYYLNVMAGPTRTWKFHIDPFFEHLV